MGQWIFNAIDRMANVPIIATFLFTLCWVQFWLAPAWNWAYPTVIGVFFVGVCVQQVSLSHIKEFTTLTSAEGYDSSNPTPEARDAIWYGLFYHIVWHLFGVVAPIV